MHDMNPQDIVGEYTEHQLNYFDGTSRKVLVTEEEIPFPKGCLIVSRTDTRGFITHANESFVLMSGYEKSELIGEPHHILRHPDMPSAAFKDLWDTLQRGEKWQGYVKNLRKNGSFYWVLATAIPNIRNGQVQGYTSVRREPSRKKVEECIALYQTLS
jgi:PAS domain S-box-containing protein